MANYKKALLVLPVVALVLLIFVTVLTTVDAFSGVYFEYGGSYKYQVCLQHDRN